MALELRRLNGEILEAEIAFPDEVSALVLKSLATRVRTKATDVVDVWRCLEVAFAAGVGPSAFVEGDPASCAAVVRMLFGARDGAGMTALLAVQRVSHVAADERFTRLRALVARVLGTG